TLDGANYEEITYEGYGPGGVAVIVHVLTDNKSRTASEIRHAFSKHGGNLGESGCVSFMFDRKGFILILDEDGEIDEEELTLAAIEAGAGDMRAEDGAYVIYTSPESFSDVCTYIERAGYTSDDEEVTRIPQTYNHVNEKDAEKRETMIDILEDNEDVQ